LPRHGKPDTAAATRHEGDAIGEAAGTVGRHHRDTTAGGTRRQSGASSSIQELRKVVG
jgi:hypothetical protein